MKVRELMKFLSKQDLDKELLVSSDEEMNALYSKWEICELSDRKNTLVIFGFSGTEVE